MRNFTQYERYFCKQCKLYYGIRKEGKVVVILKKDVKGTGKAGEVVTVSDGFARNMLLPKGLAIESTESNIRTLEKEKKEREEKYEQDRASAMEISKKISEIKVVIKTKAGENGRMFGAITSKDIADELQKQHGIVVDKKKLNLPNPIKNTGEYTVEIRLFTEVEALLKVEVGS